MKLILILSFIFQDTTIFLYSVPTYDSVGNVTIYRQSFDHIPTKKDSIDFGYRIDIWSDESKKKKSNK
jgi:hypothetical protein